MLEILLLVSLWRNLGQIAANKGRTRAWSLVAIGFWILGEIAGLLLGSLLGLELGAYVVGLGLAALGATVGWLVVKGLPPVAGYEASPF